MELELDLDLELELEWELDVDLVAGMGAAVELLYNTRYTIPAWPPPKRDFGPTRRFGPLEAIPLIEISNSGGPFQKWKMSRSLPAASYTINVFDWVLMLKVLFYKTLEGQSTWRPPHFHRFPSY